jgi:two-component system NtrC family sensor kinase
VARAGRNRTASVVFHQEQSRVITSAIVTGVLGVAVGAVIGGLGVRRRSRRTVASLESQLAAARTGSEAVKRLASAGRVAAGLAHEVGNPLCAITNYAHSLEEKVAPDLRPTVQSLQRETSRIQRMMDGLIDYARPREAGAIGADVNTALRDTLRFLGDQGVLRRITIDERLDTAALPVKGTALELEQAFANLLLNAADAMPAGGQLALWTRRLPRPTLIDGSLRRAGDDGAPVPFRRDERVERWVASHEMAQVVKVVVADSGHGVEHGHEERIFEPFVTTKAPEDGSGLGLAIVRGIVNTLGGIVWVQRSREGGAAFHIVLPVYAGDEGLPR